LETRESAFEEEDSFRGQESSQLQETTGTCQEEKKEVILPDI